MLSTGRDCTYKLQQAGRDSPACDCAAIEAAVHALALLVLHSLTAGVHRAKQQVSCPSAVPVSLSITRGCGRFWCRRRTYQRLVASICTTQAGKCRSLQNTPNRGSRLVDDEPVVPGVRAGCIVRGSSTGVRRERGPTSAAQAWKYPICMSVCLTPHTLVVIFTVEKCSCGVCTCRFAYDANSEFLAGTVVI